MEGRERESESESEARSDIKEFRCFENHYHSHKFQKEYKYS